jgi:hypothetical protein
MNMRLRAACGLGIASSAFSLSALHADFDGPLFELVEGGEEFWLATDAYIYGYPLVTMEMTRRVMTNVVAADGIRAPMGQFVRARSYPNASYRDVTAPNADTLYTTAWINVGNEPWVLSIPDMKDRYFMVPMLDGWTNVFQVPGKRTTGTAEQTYAITGPGWEGRLPSGVKEYKSPTSIVWILPRGNLRRSSGDEKATARRLIVFSAVATTELLSSLVSQCCLDGNIGQQVRRQTVPLL